MKNVRKHLEIAFADAMYQEMYITAGLIAAALETVGVSVDFDNGTVKAKSASENVVSFPGNGGK